MFDRYAVKDAPEERKEAGIGMSCEAETRGEGVIGSRDDVIPHTAARHRCCTVANISVAEVHGIQFDRFNNNFDTH